MSDDPLSTNHAQGWCGTVTALFVAESAGVEMHTLDAAEFVAGAGIAGDRYCLERGHYSHLPHPDRQLTLIAQEVIDEVAASIQAPIDGAELRRNVVTLGVPLNELVGQIFKVGPTLVYGGRLNVPCRYLERLIDKPVFEPLIGRSGLNCQILRSGTVRPGDVLETATSSEVTSVKHLISES